MAEIIGIIASISSLISFASVTSKACDQIVKEIKCFKNAPTSIQIMGAELLDLAQTFDLVHSVLHQVQRHQAIKYEHVVFVERAISGLRVEV